MKMVRRSWLYGLTFSLAALLCAPAQATNFALLLSGSSGDSVLEGCDSAEVGDITIEAVDDTPAGSEYVRKRPGKVKYQNITLRMHRDLGGSKELQAWFQEAAKGKTERKSGSIIYLDREGNEVLRDAGALLDQAKAMYTFLDCYPVRYSVAEEVLGDGSVRVLDVYELSMNGVHFTAGANNSPQLRPRIVIKTPFQNGDIPNQDRSFNSWAGGEPALITDYLFRGTLFHEQSPAKKLTTNLVLKDGRPGSALFYEWLNEYFAGKSAPLHDGLEGSKRTISLTEIVNNRRPGCSYSFFEAWPCRFSFPTFSNSSTDTHIKEVIEFVCERVERG